MKLQINKCCTRLFELYWTDTFQREVKHCSGSYESRKNKIIHIDIKAAYSVTMNIFRKILFSF